jgi:diaminohydroxyphosphoribosylaminopyrimidine deaminase/5-amino-6-(5-phosphoribosylamino)uracil reductase
VLAAFLAAGLVDEVHAYVAPLYLGAGRPAIGDLSITSLAEAQRFTLREVRQLGDSAWLRAVRDGIGGEN